MGSITKPILLAVIGILAVVLFLQTSNLITGMVGGTQEASTDVGLTNSLPSVANVAFTMQNPVGCASDAAVINCTADIIDENGVPANITGVTAELTGPVTSAGCTANKSNCRTAVCTAGAVINSSAETYVCDFGLLEFYSDNGTWTCNVSTHDGLVGASNTITHDRSTLYSIDIAPALNWGSMAVNQKKVMSDIVRNCGNRFLDVNVNASALACTSGTIGVTNLTAGITADGNDIVLSNSLARINTAHSLPVDGLTNISITTYWNLTIPTGVTGSCSGSAWFVAIENT